MGRERRQREGEIGVNKYGKRVVIKGGHKEKQVNGRGERVA